MSWKLCATCQLDPDPRGPACHDCRELNTRPVKSDRYVSRCLACWWHTWRCRCGKVLICACGVHGDVSHYKCVGDDENEGSAR